MTFKKIIAKEGLIILGVGLGLYLFLLVVPNIPLAQPKYKLEFNNGETYTIYIPPELSQGYGNDDFIKATFNPSPQLISKRIDEFIKDNQIKAAFKTAYPVNSRAVSFSEAIYSLFRLNFIIKVLIIYLLLLIVRFSVWASRALKKT